MKVSECVTSHFVRNELKKQADTAKKEQKKVSVTMLTKNHVSNKKNCNTATC